MKLPKVGDIEEGIVVRVYPKYAIMLFDGGWTGLLHISEVSNSFVTNFHERIKTGDIHYIKVIAVDEERNNIRVSIKAIRKEDRRLTYRHKKIEPSEISFSALESKLPEWVKEENEKEI